MRYVRVVVDLSKDEGDDSDDAGMCIVTYIFQRSGS